MSQIEDAIVAAVLEALNRKDVKDKILDHVQSVSTDQALDLAGQIQSKIEEPILKKAQKILNDYRDEELSGDVEEAFTSTMEKKIEDYLEDNIEDHIKSDAVGTAVEEYLGDHLDEHLTAEDLNHALKNFFRGDSDAIIEKKVRAHLDSYLQGYLTSALQARADQNRKQIQEIVENYVSVALDSLIKVRINEVINRMLQVI